MDGSELGVAPSSSTNTSGSRLKVARRAKPRGARADLEAGVGSIQWLALLTGKQHGQRFGVGLNGVGSIVQHVVACFVAEAGPCRLRCTGSGDGDLKVGDRMFRCAADSSPVAGSLMFRPPVVGWMAASSIGMRSGEDGGFGGHGSFPFLVSWIAGSVVG